MDPNKLAMEFICPMCHVLPDDPVLCDDGFVYCKGCIEHHGSMSPMTQEPIRRMMTCPKMIKNTIERLAACEEIDDSLLGVWATKKQHIFTNDPISETMMNAKKGDVKDMVNLATYYLFGHQEGIECSPTKGYHWLTKAAEEDSIIAKAYQGYCFIRGLGVDRDWDEGFELLIEAANNQDSDVTGRDIAAYTLAVYYERGVCGFKYDMRKANRWSDKVEAPPELANKMFEFDEDAEVNTTNRQDELERKSTEAFLLDTMTKAEQGYVDQMVLLARWYMFGEQDGITCDEKKGYYWATKAAEEGNMTATAYQGYCLICGLGVATDWDEGFECLIDAANQASDAIGRDLAAYSLGICYKFGLHGFKQDPAKANKWLKRVETTPNLMPVAVNYLVDYGNKLMTLDYGNKLKMFELVDKTNDDQGSDLLAQQETHESKTSGSGMLLPGGLPVAYETEYSCASDLMRDGRASVIDGEDLHYDVFSLPPHSVSTSVSSFPSSVGQSINSSSTAEFRKCASCSRDVSKSSSTLCIECRTPGNNNNSR